MASYKSCLPRNCKRRLSALQIDWLVILAALARGSYPEQSSAETLSTHRHLSLRQPHPTSWRRLHANAGHQSEACRYVGGTGKFGRPRYRQGGPDGRIDRPFRFSSNAGVHPSDSRAFSRAPRRYGLPRSPRLAILYQDPALFSGHVSLPGCGQSANFFGDNHLSALALAAPTCHDRFR